MIDEIGRGASELARIATIAHMRSRKSADGAIANLVRSGRKQPQRFRAGSSASTGLRLGASRREAAERRSEYRLNPRPASRDGPARARPAVKLPAPED